MEIGRILRHCLFLCTVIDDVILKKSERMAMAPPKRGWCFLVCLDVKASCTCRGGQILFHSRD